MSDDLEDGPSAALDPAPGGSGSGAPSAASADGLAAHLADEHVHRSGRTPWLRALVLGANDGLVSIAALLMGVGAGSSDLQTLRLTGVAGLVAGALSMGVGEYVSVASQRDAEAADLAKEAAEQAAGPAARARELAELAAIWRGRGLDAPLARAVAERLTEVDVARAHARDELGIDIDEMANPPQAAVVSMVAFALGAAVPLLASAFVPGAAARLWAVVGSATAGLAVLGATGSRLGGARLHVGTARVLVGGWLALAATYGIGRAFNVSSGG